MKSIIDHIVRVEEELKALRQTMELRFESMEKRFTTLQWFMGIGFTIISILIAVFGLFVGKV
jgi:putative exporter of polyketide antibiotics